MEFLHTVTIYLFFFIFISRSIRCEHTKRIKVKVEKPSGDLPLPQTSTLRSRRRLANILVIAALAFIGFWTPHLLCFISLEFGMKYTCTKSISEFGLLLGYAHSALSPIVYWILNHSSLKQSCCSPCTQINSAQHLLRANLR